MNEEAHSPQPFDLTPHPRILPMLGEIVLPQWRCLAELIDNSVDSFIEALRAGTPVQDPQVIISVPTGGRGQSSRLSVRDNGPGMDVDTLERAARAGWTSHDPINNLGLFGMGFNIATARLGARTTIWTTMSGTPEWVGLGIDFNQLMDREDFITPRLSRPKPNSDLSGTEVIIENLKTDQLEWFSKAYNRSNASKQLGKIYTSMIGPARTPIGSSLRLMATKFDPDCIVSGVDPATTSVSSRPRDKAQLIHFSPSTASWDRGRSARCVGTGLALTIKRNVLHARPQGWSCSARGGCMAGWEFSATLTATTLGSTY